jgi:hypothetical protein
VAFVVVVVLVALGVNASSPARAAGSATPKADPGVGTAAALAGPNCDATTKRVKLQWYTAAPCVRPWKGSDNGGATEQGVTRDAIKVAFIYTDPLPDNIKNQGNIINQATKQAGSEPDSIIDTSKVFESVYEEWGRKIDFVFVPASGPDEAAQRADAVKIAAMKPFAVLTSYAAGGAVFQAAIQDKVPVIITPFCCGLIAAEAQSNPLVQNAAEWVGKALVGRKAKWAGDTGLQSKERVFGVVAPTGPVGIDDQVFSKALAKFGGRVASTVSYPSGTVVFQPPPESVEAAPTMITKLKAAGVTTIVDFADGLSMTPALTRAATQQNYFPEWVVTGNGYHDLDVLARGADQKQWAHAFGLLYFPPYINIPKDQQTGLFQWYWGTNQGTTSGAATSLMTSLHTGVHLAGPKLTAKTFERALVDRYPPTGGAFSNQVTTIEQSWAKFGTAPPRGSAVGWWSPDTVGPSQVLGTVGPGMYMFMNGGKRYVGGHFPKGEPKLFDKSVAVSAFDALPPSDQTPTYPCNDCPSTGGGPAPSAHTG